MGTRRRRAHADDEAQAQADRREVRGRDRGALRELSSRRRAFHRTSTPITTPSRVDPRVRAVDAAPMPRDWRLSLNYVEFGTTRGWGMVVALAAHQHGVVALGQLGVLGILP